MRSSKSRDDRDLYLSNSIMSIWPEYAQSDVFYDTKLSSIKFKRYLKYWTKIYNWFNIEIRGSYIFELWSGCLREYLQCTCCWPLKSKSFVEVEICRVIQINSTICIHNTMKQKTELLVSENIWMSLPKKNEF